MEIMQYQCNKEGNAVKTRKMLMTYKQDLLLTNLIRLNEIKYSHLLFDLPSSVADCLAFFL